MARRADGAIPADVTSVLDAVADELRRLGRGPDALRRAHRLLLRSAEELSSRPGRSRTAASRRRATDAGASRRAGLDGPASW